MKVVYFGDEFHARCPELTGKMYAEPDRRIVSDQELTDMVQEGLEVSMRPATPAERSRINAWISIGELLEQIPGHIRVAMAQQGAEATERTLLQLQKAMADVTPPWDLFDTKR